MSGNKVEKTNVMRTLEQKKIAYTAHYYDHSDGQIDAVSVAKKLGQKPEQVFKTLVTQGSGKGYFVFVLPAETELDLKAAARAVGEKSIAMIPVAQINKVTGYIRGGCSPIGMKKQYPTVLDSSALRETTIMVSAGKIGSQVEVNPQDLLNLIGGKTADIAIKMAME
ncbi:MAG: Cys-tRNA(Pro) deacylase [Candidatus Merdivicinus sp.]|jgi:Cys-tRNA(Pro)/Cys-tRNA(Cys) deacylase